ncbi:MAG: LexA family protein [Candidatus Komeilibacteria bacterium]
MDESIKKTTDQLHRFWRQNKRLPSFAELAKLCGYASKNAASKLIKRLREEQIVDQDKTGRLIPGKLFSALPWLGSVQAGFPSPAEEELIDTLTLDEYLIDNPTASFLVEVSGESMLDAGLHPHDLVVVDRKRQAHDNDIVLAKIDGDWTLKYLRHQGKKTFLQAANDNYPQLIPQDELEIGGVIVAAIRKYK